MWVRGLLSEQYGVELSSVSWFQGEVNEPGRVEGIDLQLPPKIEVTPVRDRSLSEMLVDGDLDAVISARPPRELARPNGRVRRLFDDPRAVEREYYLATGVFPIMHVIALRERVYERNPWIAMNLLKAFEGAKRTALERALDTAISRYPLPWGAALAAEAREDFGDDPWPYGIEANRWTLETFLRFAHEQGLTASLLSPEELFVPEVQASYREMIRPHEELPVIPVPSWGAPPGSRPAPAGEPRG